MEPEYELRLVRWAIIITIIVCVMSLVIYDLVYFLTHNTVLDVISVKSEFGEITLFNTPQYSFAQNIYQDKNLGFQILIPNENWKVTSMSDEMDEKTAQLLKTKGFLDGIYLTQNNKTHFMVAIFDIKGKSSFDLANYVDTQIETMKDNSNMEITLKQVSSSNDWSIFGAHDHSGTLDSYGEQLLYLENDMLYMLQYTGLSPSEMGTEIKSQYRSIIDSFEILG